MVAEQAFLGRPESLSEPQNTVSVDLWVHPIASFRAGDTQCLSLGWGAMSDEVSEHDRANALSEIRAIRARHGLNKSRRPKSGDVEAVDLSESVRTGADPSIEDLDDPMAIKYALELGAHRETTDRLLAEKDRTIETQAALIAELRNQIAATNPGSIAPLG